MRVEPRALPSQYSHQQVSGQLQLKAYFYQLDDWGEMRCVLIQAPKIHIINIFFFPEARWSLPVYAMEFVVLGHKPIVAVIDALSLLTPAPCNAALKQLLLKAHQDFQHLQQAEDMPKWYQDCRSGQDFFVRPENLEALNDISQAHLQVWQSVMGLLQTAQSVPSEQQAAHAQALTAYKKHHCDNTPGLKLLQQKFGVEWTQVFLRDYLFA